jgi:ComF family protein
VRPQLAKFKGAALDLLFPQKCLGCGEEGGLLCPTCQKTLLRIMPPVCPKCGRPQMSGIICPGCVSWLTAVDGIRSPLRFDGIIRTAIHQFKYNNLRSIAKPLANFLLDYLINNPVPGNILVPVPLHAKRLRERGYNQSGLLAKELGKSGNWQIIDDCLIRLNYDRPQVRTTSVDERRRNVNQAFICRNDKMAQKQVILIDDVSTSGATLDACARALKSAGALSVWGLVLAREI